jgi:hypothetical protein
MNRNILINRESVCMGDDCENHELKIKINESTTLRELIINLINMRYLASIAGGKAVWVLKFHTQLLAVIAQEWNKPQYLVNANIKVYDLLNTCDKPELFFEYLMQINPNIVYQKLRKLIDNNIVVNGKVRDFNHL